MDIKECSKCKESKNITEYYKRSDTGKHRNECNDCRNKYNLELYHKNPKQKENHRKASWKHQIKKKYGLTVEEFRELEIEQNYKCACCGISKEQTQQTELYVDHDHLTGEIRGLLCLQCNTGIGILGDNLEGVQKAYDYLFRHYKED